MLSGAKKHVKNTSKIGDFSYLQHFSGIGRLSASHFLKRPRDGESSLSDANLISFMPEFVNFLQALEGLNLGAFYLLPRFLQSCCRDLVMACIFAEYNVGCNASFLKSREQANPCKNSGVTEEVVQFK